jgi:hypothetical protein
MNQNIGNSKSQKILFEIKKKKKNYFILKITKLYLKS